MYVCIYIYIYIYMHTCRASEWTLGIMIMMIMIMIIIMIPVITPVSNDNTCNNNSDNTRPCVARRGRRVHKPRADRTPLVAPGA